MVTYIGMGIAIVMGILIGLSAMSPGEKKEGKMETPTDTDRLDIKSWAEGQANELRMAIKSYLALGWDKQTAIDTVLNNSCLGSGYKAQIRYEFKYYRGVTR